MRRLLLGYLLCLISFWVQGQTADPDAFAKSVVTLNMSDMKFDKILPFDKAFTIHLKNIPAAFHIVNITISENQQPPASRRKSKGSQPSQTPTTGQVIALEPWIRSSWVSGETEGDILEPIYLAPNTDYILKISGGIEANLTARETDALSDALSSDPKITSIINDLAGKSANDPGSALSKYNPLINEAFEKAIKDFDEKLVFKKVNWRVILNDLRTFRQKISEMRASVEDFKNEADVDQNDIDLIEKSTQDADWGFFAPESPEYEVIDSLISKIKSDDTKKNSGNATSISTNATNLLDLVNGAINSRDDLIKEMVENVAIPNTVKLQVLNSTYRSDFVNNAKLQVNLDAGIAYVGRVDRVMTYSGFNIYFRPVDKGVPFSTYHSLGKQLAVRTSFLIGISLSSIEKANARKGLIDNKAIVLGAGFRITSFLKINAGAFCHQRYAANPLIDPERHHFSMSPFVSLSLDMDVKPLFAGLSDSIFK